jgi:hypothetical protein
VRRDVSKQLGPLRIAKCPFIDLPNSKTSHWGGGVTPEQMNEMRWVKSTLVAQIRFVEWTAVDHLGIPGFSVCEQTNRRVRFDGRRKGTSSFRYILLWSPP